MPNFSIGLSALRSSQFALEVVSNNVSNANTEGYHRRRVEMESAQPDLVGGLRIGNGVSISRIHRVRDRVTELSLTSVTSDVNHVEQLLTIERKIEIAILNGDNSVGRQLDQFFAEFTNLSASPGEPAQHSALLESGKQLSSAIRDAARQLADLTNNVRLQIDNEIEALNGDMQELNEVSRQIVNYSSQGIDHNNELDQRDAVLNRIAERLGISRNEQADGQLHLTIGNHSIQQGSRANQFSTVENDSQIEVMLDDSDRPLTIDSGRLAALVEAYNSIIPAFEEKLDQLSSELIQNVNAIHSTGIGTAGAFQNLVGTVNVDDSSLPLAEALPDANLTAGELTVSVTDAAGERQTFTITVDPAVDTLDDIATRIGNVAGLTAAVRPITNQFQVTAAAGLQFDFAGGFGTQPDLGLYSGTSVPSLSGVYTGQANEEITVRIEGSGQVGRSANLFANVYSSSGALLSQVNVGEGYEAGSEIELDDGVRVSFGVGSLNNDDQFSTRLTGEADQTGLLAALGMNGFFRGSDAKSIAVDKDILADSSRIATGRSGEAADTSNLTRFIALDNTAVFADGQTLTQFTSEVATEIGFEINSNTSLNASLTTFKLRLEQQRDSKSGVDLNEELVYLQEYQKSYEAAVRIIQATDDMLNELFRIIG